MDNDADQTARDWLSRSPSDKERAAEVIRLRERLAFYQSFDGLIQDNIARSSDLLRQAMQMRESAAAEIASARDEIEQNRAEDRERYRLLFSGLLDEVTTVQVQAERLARRLTSALDQLEIDGSASTHDSLSPLPTDLNFDDANAFLQTLTLDEPEPLASNDAIADIIDPTDEDDTSPILTPESSFSANPEEQSDRDEVVAIKSNGSMTEELPSIQEIDAAIDEAIGQEDEEQSPASSASDSTPTADDAQTDDIPVDIQPFTADDIEPKYAASSTDDRSIHQSSDAEAVFPELSPSTRFSNQPVSPNATIVLVHGVPRATTALSLKRYLEGLDYVGTVEPREFAEGILRLEVSGDRPLAFDDLRSWPDGLKLEPVHLRDDLVEVRLSQ